MSHQLVPVSAPRQAHRDGCTFGSGFYRIVMTDGSRRFCQSEGEVEFVSNLLPAGAIARVQRDGFCLDDAEYTATGDARTPDVLDGARFLDLPREEGIRELGVTDEADYARAYRAVEEAVLERDRQQAHGGVHASIVIKRKGRPSPVDA
jgi:hypothetical protein